MYIWITVLYQLCILQIVFPVCDLYFHFLNVFAKQTFLILMSIYQFFSFMNPALGVYLKSHCQIQGQLDFPLRLSSRCFYIYIQVCDPFLVSFCEVNRSVSTSFFYTWMCSCSNTICWKDYFVPLYCLCSFVQDQLIVHMWSVSELNVNNVLLDLVGNKRIVPLYFFGFFSSHILIYVYLSILFPIPYCLGAAL